MCEDPHFTISLSELTELNLLDSIELCWYAIFSFRWSCLVLLLSEPRVFDFRSSLQLDDRRCFVPRFPTLSPTLLSS